MNIIDKKDSWHRCAGCGEKAVEVTLDLGLQPPSNKFLESLSTPCPGHPLRFGACHSCGLAQLVEPMPRDMLAGNSPWLRYEEPESHLDDLCEYLSSLVGNRVVTAAGMSYKDASLLRRLENTGWSNRGIDGSTIAQTGQPDVLVARHILEHAANPRRFALEAARAVRPDGLLVFEVPGSERILSQHHHCFVWEEHIVYFTRQTLMSFLQGCGLEILDLLEYRLPMENSLVAVTRLRHTPPTQIDHENSAAQFEFARGFGASLSARARIASGALGEARTSSGRACLFGAGHLGMKYINFYGLASYLDTVIDDSEHKKDTFLPFSGLRITDSSWLSAHPESFCLVAINPEKHALLAENHGFFRQGTGHWQSIFSSGL